LLRGGALLRRHDIVRHRDLKLHTVADCADNARAESPSRRNIQSTGTGAETDAADCCAESAFWLGVSLAHWDLDLPARLWQKLP
jgi:hypothetical protein